MASRGKSICRKVGCNNLIDSPGYCELHHKDANPFRSLDSKKTPETLKFYQSGKWTKTSITHRKRQPLCQDCLRKGIVTQGTLVHHEPSLTDLLLRGLNPFSSKYLETLCHNCHQGHLRAKRS